MKFKVNQPKKKMTKEESLIDNMEKNYSLFYETIRTSNKDELEQKLVRLSAQLNVCRSAFEEPKIKDELATIKDAKKELDDKKKEIEGPIKDAIKEIQSKIDFVIFMMRAKQHPTVTEVDNQNKGE